jgi:hypothetical protein
MEYNQGSRLNDYWFTLEQFYGLSRENDERRTLSYNEISTLIDSKDEHDKTNENCQSLWKMRTVFNKLYDVYAEYYSPTEHLAFVEIKSLFRVDGRAGIPIGYGLDG